jgi:Flp pilus assembly protein TadG
MRRKREAGQAIVVVALGLVVLLGALGLGIDFGYLRYQKRQMQTAADAAAIAAAAMLDFGNSSSMTTAATTMTAKNGFTNGTSGVTVHVYNPPTDLPAGQGAGQDPNNGNSKFVSVVVSQNQPTFFAKAFGVTSVPLSARAEGAEGGGNNCIFALDPTGTGLAVDLLAAITSQCGIVVESSGGSALQCGLFAALNASSIGVVGGVSDFLCGISPNPKTGISVPNPADPLAGTPVPPNAGSACGSRTASPYTGYAGSAGTPSHGLQITAHNQILNPGVYCGGITILPGATVTMNAGTYVLKTAPRSNPTN